MSDSEERAAERLLLDIVDRAAATDRSREWVRAAAATVEGTAGYAAIARPYAAASRFLREARAVPTAEQTERIDRFGLGSLGRHDAIALFRGALLLACCRCLPAEARPGLIDRVFRSGDSQERVALLAVLPALPTGAIYRETAVEACRSNVRDVFEAIACENDYPARHFSDEAFNQMVMKAVFSGISLGRIRGLSGRVNSELERMARDYSAERRAAGREVPADLARLVTTQGGV